MSRKNRSSKPTKVKSTRRRTRRKKRSKLFAALVIEVIAAVALFAAVRFAQDVRASQRLQSSGRAQSENVQTESMQSPALWDKFASAASASITEEASDQTPIFRTSRLIGFAPEGS